MRIIGGGARGIILEAGTQEDVRPTTDRIKETIFNILGDINNLVVIDFFAGSGSLGLEALSRGAAEVYFVEKDAKTCQVIAKNLEKVKKSMGSCGKTQILNMDYSKSWQKINSIPQLILADPPYKNNSQLAGELLISKNLASISDKSTRLVLEHTMGFTIPTEISWRQLRRQDFGLTAFTFWQLKETENG